MGAANLAAAVSGAIPVSGGFSRSTVNFSAGARTQLAAMVTAVMVALVAHFFTPLFYFLPKAVLASGIVVAVATLEHNGEFSLDENDNVLLTWARLNTSASVWEANLLRYVQSIESFLQSLLELAQEGCSTSPWGNDRPRPFMFS